MNRIKHKILKLLFFVSLIPAIAIISISIYYSFEGHTYYDWFEPDKVVYVAYGLEEFMNSIFYYGGYLTLCIPIIPICIFYQIFYLYIRRKANYDLAQ